MKIYRIPALMLVACGGALLAHAAPFRVGIVGLADGHVNGVLNGGDADPASGRFPSRLLVPGGPILNRADVQIVGFAEPDRKVFDRYVERLHLDPNLYFASVDELISRAHPEAVLVFTATLDHTRIVQECAKRGVHVMMEKPLAVSYKDALAMADVAEKGHVHVLVDYETSWYPNNKAAYDLLQEGALGPVWKIVTHHGNSGPFSSRMRQSGFANFHEDPELSGAGVLFNFGCYGADLVTWLMKGQAPSTVTAVASQLNPGNHSKVDDEADIILTYPSAIAILQTSWNWPFSRKDMEIYGRTGTAKTMITTTSFETDKLEVRRAGEKEPHVISGPPVQPPYDDPLHYFAAVVRGEIQENGSLSSLQTNVLVSEILDAARRSVQTGKTVALPLDR
jgi:predicted dehydrogenase